MNKHTCGYQRIEKEGYMTLWIYIYLSLIVCAQCIMNLIYKRNISRVCSFMQLIEFASSRLKESVKPSFHNIFYLFKKNIFFFFFIFILFLSYLFYSYIFKQDIKSKINMKKILYGIFVVKWIKKYNFL